MAPNRGMRPRLACLGLARARAITAPAPNSTGEPPIRCVPPARPTLNLGPDQARKGSESGGLSAALLLLSEADLLRGVLDLMRVLGWRCIHVRPARTAHGWRTPVQGDGAGWPDILAVRGPRLIAAELKAQRGRLTPEQAAWLEALSSAGAETYTWRPADYPDAITEVLA